MVHEPGLSKAANEALTVDAREAVGADHVRVPADRAHASRGEHEDLRRNGIAALYTSNRFILWQVGGALIVVLAIVGLTANRWWLLPAGIVVLGLGTFAIVRMVLGMTADVEHPEPTTVAMLEEQGVRDPEHLFSDIVAEFTESQAAPDSDARTVAVEDDPATAAAEQRTAPTPSGGPSRAVGPGADAS